MDKELIGKIRCVLDFIEKYDELVDKAKRSDDAEWENALHALFSHANHDMRDACPGSLATNRTKSRQFQMKSLSENKIRNKLAQSKGNVYLCTARKSRGSAPALSAACLEI